MNETTAWYLGLGRDKMAAKPPGLMSLLGEGFQVGAGKASRLPGTVDGLDTLQRGAAGLGEMVGGNQLAAGAGAAGAAGLAGMGAANAQGRESERNRPMLQKLFR